MRRAREPLKRGYDVDENAIRFSNYFHVLRELVHLSAGWLPLVPPGVVPLAEWRPPIAGPGGRAPCDMYAGLARVPGRT